MEDNRAESNSGALPDSNTNGNASHWMNGRTLANMGVAGYKAARAHMCVVTHDAIVSEYCVGADIGVVTDDRVD